MENPKYAENISYTQKFASIFITEKLQNMSKLAHMTKLLMEAIRLDVFWWAPPNS
jgi:hypothetical protein